MNTFTGLWRRMEFLRFNTNNAPIYTDYGHHPTEINAVYEAMRDKYIGKKLIAVVQPHQMRRVLEFWPERVHVLKQFDKVYLYPIYAAREDIAILLKEYNHDFLTQTASADDVSTFLASQVNATFVSDPRTVKDIMDKAESDSVVILFTA